VLNCFSSSKPLNIRLKVGVFFTLKSSNSALSVALFFFNRLKAHANSRRTGEWVEMITL